MKCKLNIYGRISEPNRKFQRPRISVVIDDTIDIDVANVSEGYKAILERLEHVLREFRAPYETHDRAGFAAVRTESAGE